jgi:chromosomal replication initiation ATPase DnaA
MTPDKLPALSVAAVARAFRIPAAELRREGREQPAMFARQVSWWLLEDVVGWPHTLIARYAQRDRSAVSHGITTVLNRLETERTFSLIERIAAARQMFTQKLEGPAFEPQMDADERR